jgi:GMP synthase (glutamine-hydrolysing)
MNILAVIPGSMQGLFDAGTIGEMVLARGGTLDWNFRSRGDALPKSAEGFDALIAFGGEMSLFEPAHIGYFDELAVTIRAFHDAGKPILGSCLGAQAIAHAFGEKVWHQGFFEYGFTPLRKEKAAGEDALLADVPDIIPLFEMHSDTFSLPGGAVRLMRGTAVENQAFRLDDATYAFQCHFEVTPEIVKVWSDRELANYTGKPDGEQIAMLDGAIASFDQHGAAQRDFGLKVMNRWIDLVQKRASLETCQAE